MKNPLVLVALGLIVGSLLGADREPPKTIEAKEILLRSPDGKAQIALGFLDGEPMVVLKDSTGNNSLTFRVTTDEASATATSKDLRAGFTAGKGSALVAVAKGAVDAGTLAVLAVKQEASLSLEDEKGKRRVLTK